MLEEDIKLLEQTYYNLSKEAKLNPFVAAGGIGGLLGGLYGLGDTDHNYQNKLLHKSTASRLGQGAIGGIGGVGMYKILRGLGQGRFKSGLGGLLSAAGAAALSSPKLKNENPYKLPF